MMFLVALSVLDLFIRIIYIGLTANNHEGTEVLHVSSQPVVIVMICEICNWKFWSKSYVDSRRPMVIASIQV